MPKRSAGHIKNRSQSKYVEDYRKSKRKTAKIEKTRVVYTKDEVKYLVWMYEVERIVIEKTFVDSLLDLPDQMYRINFDDGTTPKEMADIVIKDYFGFLNSFT